MSRIDSLKKEVDNLYLSRNENRADWADWLFEHHVFLVANYARKLSEKLGVNNDLAVAAAMLHDIADAVIKRESPEHENKNFEIVRELLLKSGFNTEEIRIINDDALRFHGCHGSERPATIEGKILATADAVIHLNSDFYKYAVSELKKTNSDAEVFDWVLSKIERDFNNKILFDDVRDEFRICYNQAKDKFQHL